MSGAPIIPAGRAVAPRCSYAPRGLGRVADYAERVITAEHGDLLVVPPFTPHAFTAAKDSEAGLLVIITPGQLDQVGEAGDRCHNLVAEVWQPRYRSPSRLAQPAATCSPVSCGAGRRSAPLYRRCTPPRLGPRSPLHAHICALAMFHQIPLTFLGH